MQSIVNNGVQWLLLDRWQTKDTHYPQAVFSMPYCFKQSAPPPSIIDINQQASGTIKIWSTLCFVIIIPDVTEVQWVFIFKHELTLRFQYTICLKLKVEFIFFILKNAEAWWESQGRHSPFVRLPCRREIAHTVAAHFPKEATDWQPRSQCPISLQSSNSEALQTATDYTVWTFISIIKMLINPVMFFWR